VSRLEAVLAASHQKVAGMVRDSDQEGYEDDVAALDALADPDGEAARKLVGAVAGIETKIAVGVHHLARAWASIDGKRDEFDAGDGAASLEDEPGGHFSGYMADTEELVARAITYSRERGEGSEGGKTEVGQLIIEGLEEALAFVADGSKGTVHTVQVNDLVEICRDDRGNAIYREPNEVGGHRYWSDSVGGGVLVWDTALVSKDDLLLVIEQEDKRLAVAGAP
jgi:hypothetical protein